MTALSKTAAEGQQVRRSPDVLRQMADAAMLAPSPENTQLWRFRIGTAALKVALCKANQLPSDVTGLLAFTSLGAAIENAIIVAREQQLDVEVELLADDAAAPTTAGDESPSEISTANVASDPSGTTDR